MFSEIKSAGLFGLNAFMVTVQASIAPGQPSFDIVGMPDIAVQESKAPHPRGAGSSGAETALTGRSR